MTLKHFFLWINAFLLTTTTAAASPPQVVVTIKPLHALVTGIMAGVGQPYLLLSGEESPHTYNLRPSQVKQLQQANLLIWVGPGVETFMTKVVTTLGEKTQVLQLFNSPGLTPLKARQGGNWEAHHELPQNAETTVSSPDADTEQHIHDMDQHVWLDPINAKAMVKTIVATLSQLDGQNRAYYITNATRLISRLDQLDKELQQQLAPLRAKQATFIVFHDAYQYLEKRYHLTAVGSISISPETPPSAKHLHELREKIKTLQVQCVFSEPQFDVALINTLTEGTSARQGTLDPLGVQIKPGVEAYFTLLHNLANSLQQCLQK